MQKEGLPSQNLRLSHSSVSQIEQECQESLKDSHSTKFEPKTRIFLKLSLRELCGSNLPGLHL